MQEETYQYKALPMEENALAPHEKTCDENQGVAVAPQIVGCYRKGGTIRAAENEATTETFGGTLVPAQ